MINFEEYEKIVKTADVSTLKDCAVVYSISYLPTKENKDKADAFVKQNPKMKMLDQTSCGKILVDLEIKTGSKTCSEKLRKLWGIASKRFIMAASGNLTAFVENADQRSTFVSVELPCILENQNIHTINGMDKTEFLKSFSQFEFV